MAVARWHGSRVTCFAAPYVLVGQAHPLVHVSQSWLLGAQQVSQSQPQRQVPNKHPSSQSQLQSLHDCPSLRAQGRTSGNQGCRGLQPGRGVRTMPGYSQMPAAAAGHCCSFHRRSFHHSPPQLAAWGERGVGASNRWRRRVERGGRASAGHVQTCTNRPSLVFGPGVQVGMALCARRPPERGRGCARQRRRPMSATSAVGRCS